jgi:apolipoprotein N-acyltransferase
MFQRTHITLSKWSYLLMALSALFFAFALEQKTLSWVIAGTLVVSATFAYIIAHDIIVWRNKRTRVKKINIIINDLYQFLSDGRRIRELELANPMTLEEYTATVIPWRESILKYLEQNCPDMVKRFDISLHREPIEFLLDNLLEIIRHYQDGQN